MALLEVRGLQVSYGPIQAVRGIDLDVEQGQIVALLGANGAGKTTTLRAISGVVRPTAGTITENGQPLGKRACKVARQGISMSPEGRLVFYGLTVEENLRAGAYILRDKGRVHQNMRRIYDLFPVLEQRRRQQASTLSGGEQQMLAIGRALMADPKILLLDGPGAPGHQGYFPRPPGGPRHGHDHPDCGTERLGHAEDRRLRLCARAGAHQYVRQSIRTH